jgi:pyruvate,water dikinase
MRRALLSAGDRLAAQGRLQHREDIFEATTAELQSLLGAGPGAPTAVDLATRTADRVRSALVRPPARLGDAEEPPPDEPLQGALGIVNGAFMLAMSVEDVATPAAIPAEPRSRVIEGLTASRGSYEGRACVVREPGDFSAIRQGDILVAPFTTPAYNVVLPLLGAVVTDKGGVLSHAAIVAREYGIPAVVATGNATASLKTGDRLRVDGEHGTVEVLVAAVAGHTA